MKNFIKSFRLTLVFCVFFSVCYILVLWIFAQFAGPNSGNAEVVELNGKVVGAANVGQSFTEDIYFWGRPSCAGDGYDATSSAGSNKGPTNAEYLAEVEARIDTFLKHHPYLSRKEVYLPKWSQPAVPGWILTSLRPAHTCRYNVWLKLAE